MGFYMNASSYTQRRFSTLWRCIPMGGLFPARQRIPRKNKRLLSFSFAYIDNWDIMEITLA